jgi:ABC-type nitrate/sulfonate/bicarbonate transport system substrate-binding protein
VLVATVVVLIVLAGIGAWYLNNSPATYAGKTESITFGLTPSESAALLYIAEDQQFFAENGLNVTIRDYDTGPKIIQAMENNVLDMSGSTEYPIVTEALNNKNISIIGCDVETQTFYCIGRKDHGIENISDLRGKKIGLARGTINEFYFGRFLDLHGIDPRDVEIVDVAPSQFVNAIVNGTFDAIVCMQLYVNQIQQRLGNDTVVWPVQSSQLTYCVIACRDDWAAQHPELIKRFLKSLDQSVDYTVDHPDEAEAIVQKRLQLDDAYLASVWPGQHFSLTLDQAMVLAMEDEGRWMIKNNLTAEKEIPDFRKYIYTKGLEEIKPEAVNII